MIDPYLAALVHAAEDGADTPALWMTLYSGDVVTGTPCPSGMFVEVSHADLYQRHYREPGRKKGDRQQAAVDAATQDVRPLRETDGSRHETVTLKKARVLWGGRTDGADLPIVRVNLNAVALWWLAGGKEFKGGSNAFFGVGIAF